MDNKLIELLSTLGIGGILAGFIFIVYRKDMKQYVELWRTTTEQLLTIVKENTASNTKLVSVIEDMEYRRKTGL